VGHELPVHVDLISFSDRPPSLEALAERVAARSGLSVQVDPLSLEDGRYLVQGRLSFACLPKVTVEVTCDSPEWKRHLKRRQIEVLGAGGRIPPRHLQALERPRPHGCQVWVKGFGSVEPALFWYTVLALEDLGGALSRTDKPLSHRERRYYDDLRRQYGESLTEADLFRRVRAADRSQFWKTCLAFPILLPVSALFWTVVGILLLRDLLRGFSRGSGSKSNGNAGSAGGA
jgi:hypothetical protein